MKPSGGRGGRKDAPDCGFVGPGKDREGSSPSDRTSGVRDHSKDDLRIPGATAEELARATLSTKPHPEPASRQSVDRRDGIAGPDAGHHSMPDGEGKPSRLRWWHWVVLATLAVLELPQVIWNVVAESVKNQAKRRPMLGKALKLIGIGLWLLLGVLILAAVLFGERV